MGTFAGIQGVQPEACRNVELLQMGSSSLQIEFDGSLMQTDSPTHSPATHATQR